MESSSNRNVLISVGIIACNHAGFIAKAIDSVLEQEMPYNMEILVFDDASSDATPEIIRQYEEKHPEIRAYYGSERLGPFEMARKFSLSLKGDYVTWLDADDYWTYKEKLKKQIGFLEANGDYIGTFHDAEIHCLIPAEGADEMSSRQAHREYKYYSQFNQYKSEFTPFDLLHHNLIATATLIFRSVDFTGFFNRFAGTTLSLNWALHLYIIQWSKFYYFNEVWSVYNDHNDGISKRISSFDFNRLNILILKKYRWTRFYRQFINYNYRMVALQYDQVSMSRKNDRRITRFYLLAWWNQCMAAFFDIVLLIRNLF